jgi:hypothetical protein
VHLIALAKAAVEATIGALQRSFFQTYRHHTFYSLDELNRKFRSFLDDFNNRKMKDYGVSRRMRFEMEAPLLKPVATEPYEIITWKKAKVHPDCCIQVQKAFYSVPYKYCGQEVRVKAGRSIVEIFDQDLNPIACHKRVTQYKKALDESHFPPSAMQSSSTQVRKALKDSSRIGPKTYKLVKELFSGSHPYKNLRRVQGILRLKKEGYSTSSLEYACSNALTFCRYRLEYIKSCADHHQTAETRVNHTGVPRRDSQTIHLHGD